LVGLDERDGNNNKTIGDIMATKNTDKTEDKPAVVIELTADEIKANAKAAKVQIDMINNLETAQEGLAAAIAYRSLNDENMQHRHLGNVFHSCGDIIKATTTTGEGTSEDPLVVVSVDMQKKQVLALGALKYAIDNLSNEELIAWPLLSSLIRTRTATQPLNANQQLQRNENTEVCNSITAGVQKVIDLSELAQPRTKNDQPQPHTVETFNKLILGMMEKMTPLDANVETVVEVNNG
tara:strand:+ start:171 stop:881 length:711 start_codon:yes stop_codon:yes gene_type:complete